MGLAGRLAINSIVQAAGSALAALLGFFLFIAVARTLGASAYGDFATATAVLAIPVVLADLGLSATVVREISADPGRTERAVGASLPLRAGLSFAFVGLTVCFAFLLPFSRRAEVAILIGSLGAFFTLLSFAVVPVLQARLRMHWSAVATVVGRGATLALALGFLAAGFGVNAVMAATVVGLAVTFAVTAFGAARIVRLRPIVDVPYWRSLIRVSLTMGGAMGLAQLTTRVDVIALALLKTSQEVGWYGAAIKFVEYSGLIANALAFSLFPVFARFAATDKARFSRFLQSSLELMLALAAPIAVVGVLLAPEIIDLTAGPEFENGVVALRLLAPSLLAGFLVTSYWFALISAGQERTLLGVAAAILVLNIAANFIVIWLFGYKGAAVVALATVFVELTVLAYLAWRRMGFVPDPRYTLVVGVCTTAMVLAIALLPGPRLLIGGLAIALYGSLLLVLPGTVRELGTRVLADLRASR
jgi:O-antigen/teichoic acid export membrane protein